MINDIPVLYVFVRTDLQSMNPGKAQAHSGHAANAFVFKHYIVPLTTSGYTIDTSVIDWMRATPQGFGTQINLVGAWDQITDTVTQAKELGFAAGIVTDPTYPYEVTGEIYNLLPANMHTAPSVIRENGRVVCFRNEETAAYIFGYKSQLERFVGHFPLHP